MSGSSQFSGRVFRPYFFALALVIGAAMFTAYFASVEYIKNSSYLAAEQLAGKTVSQADSYINDLDILAEQIKRQPDITNTFYKLADDDDPENYFSSDTLKNIDISTSLKNLLATRSRTCNILIYNNNGDIISSNEYRLNSDITDKILSSYDNTLQSISQGGGRIILFPTDSVSEPPYITLAKALKNDYSDDICGIVEVQSTVSAFLDAVTADSDSEYTVSVCDRATGEVISGGSSDEDITNTITEPLSNTNWEISIGYKTPVNRAFYIRLGIAIAFAYILLLFIVFRITRLIGIRISEPLIKLTEHVRAINAPDAGIDLIDNAAIDEIQALEESFEKMFKRIDYLMTQEKKAYSLALQAQMNPHFLYNTLAVIGAAGEEGDSKAVGDMCAELSQMLRYITEYQTVTVSLEDEIAHTKNYLSLMKSRYEDYFTYTIDVDDELLKIPVPKLCIQPLAENCFKHGFKDAAPPWSISIKMKGTQALWEFEISDNGSGISPETVDLIAEQVNKAVKLKSFDNTVGLGVANTIIRLKMTHNEKINYFITNDNGTRIKIISWE